MEFVALGKTKLLVSRTSFGAMSLDCKEIEAFGEEADEKACALVRQAYVAGINFFDSSRNTPVCEKRLGAALHGIRQNVLLSTKTSADSPEKLLTNFNESLDALETDCIDLYQYDAENSFVPRKDGADGLYAALLSLKDKGLVKHIGFVSEDLGLAKEAIECGDYETVQFPFSMISGKENLDLVHLCEDNEVGCIAMQPLNGGVVSNIPLALGFLSQFEHVVPVWGAHTQEELDKIIHFSNHLPVIDDQFLKDVDRIRDFFN